LLLDADLGLANVDVLLGLHPTHNLSHVMSGECCLEDILLTGPGGVRIVPASSGIQRMAGLTTTEHAGIVSAFGRLETPLDVLIIDSAAGISDSVITFSRAAHDVLIVLCDEPASLTDAYALIKLLSRDHGVRRFHVVANRVPGARQGQDLYRKLVKVTDRFLDVVLEFLGSIPEDPQLRKSVQAQRAVVEAFPRCSASGAFRRMASDVDGWRSPIGTSGHVQFFLERVIHGEISGEVA
jgi:flagellar biosynthesis protein FlhG